ncbi:hypothetical protein E3O42_15070 [Cryobacterium adonitolivorans]|uniref:Uncharacterized protein n=1 Tax=Cryobacterium adonitolivorans TaxID=1259189 RepID=A0A4R8W066_9MICO|nr:hypothetical protein [Cryobacterium adonitolivorans]TFB98686.1 hypothetical protein E3O42_15070 [Cryobacterium adonitolivorans]
MIHLGRTIVQAALKTALVLFDALNIGPGSATSSVAHLPVVLPRLGEDEPPAVQPRWKPRFPRRRPRRSN